MKLRDTQRKIDMWYGNEETFAARKEAIQHANETGTNYQIVRSLQQAMPEQLVQIQDHMRKYIPCTDCRLGLCPFVRNKVFFRGYLPCDVCFVGEAPGKNEDAQGVPFIGESGNVMDDIIKDMSRRLYGESYDNRFRWCLTNSVLCLPYAQGEIREPERDEIKSCSSKLAAFLSIASPKLIVQVGVKAKFAMELLQPSRSQTPTAFQLQLSQTKQCYIPHPAWMLRQKHECDLHIKKAVLNLTPHVRQVLGL